MRGEGLVPLVRSAAGASDRLCCTGPELLAAIERVREPLRIVRMLEGGAAALRVMRAPEPSHAGEALPEGVELVGTLPPLYPEWLGDRAFAETHGCRFPYVVGEMARGIATARMVVEAARAGLMSFFGSAGLPLAEIETAIRSIRQALGPEVISWGANLIHTPNEPELEEAVADLFLKLDVRRASASAFMALSPAVVRFACKGLERGPDGAVRRKSLVFAKISRPEVAAHFMSPPPERLLRELVAAGRLTAEEASLASGIPVAEDVTVEADSGGHTDNRPLTALLPVIMALRDELATRFGYRRNVRVGVGGGLGTPGALAAAFHLGAAYVLSGSINQCAMESGLSASGRAMLAQADLADVAMAPAADMFELGIKVQVLKRGTMFAVRAQRLYELYTAYTGLEAFPRAERERLEKELFRAPLEAIWARTRAYFLDRDPALVERAERDRSTSWRWSSAGTCSWPRAGPPMASSIGGPTTRSGAVPRWAPSTPGPGARSWSGRRTGPSCRSRATTGAIDQVGRSSVIWRSRRSRRASASSTAWM